MQHPPRPRRGVRLRGGITARVTGRRLARVVGLPGAVLMGLGSIVGTGVFVSVGLAAGVAGPAVVIAVAIAAGLAACNGLSSAQLAASHPVSGGTYEYGYRYLTPALGFVAGWLFLLAKSASAATAALGFSDYLLAMIGMDRWRIPIAASAVLVLMLLVLRGIKRSNAANAVIVTISVGSLIWFMATGAPNLDLSRVTFFSMERTGDLLEAIALMFVAYTGYGRIATLGEEVKDPEKTIPRAIVAALGISMLLYIGVALIGVGTGAAPLGKTVAIGATAAMLGVVLNLILG